MSHQTISFVKSGIRIVGYLIMPVGWAYSGYGTQELLWATGLTLVFSELIGIYEEIGH